MDKNHLLPARTFKLSFKFEARRRYALPHGSPNGIEGHGR